MGLSPDDSTVSHSSGRPGPNSTIRAVFFDFGGVITTSPFHAFDRYERQNGLPTGFIRRVNSTNPDDNAWARFERQEVDGDGFVTLFEAEALRLGHEIDGRAVLGLVAGEIRPAMIEAVDSIRGAGLITACLTNNFTPIEPLGDESVQHASTGATTSKMAQMALAMSRFDHVIQSSVIGVRKPEVGFYRAALDAAAVEPVETVFLDDLGVNLKPARAMGMTTIKVDDPDVALAELESVLGVSLTG